MIMWKKEKEMTEYKYLKGKEAFDSCAENSKRWQKQEIIVDAKCAPLMEAVIWADAELTRLRKIEQENYCDLLDQMLESRIVHKPTTRLREENGRLGGRLCRARDVIMDAISALKAREETDGTTDGLIPAFEYALSSSAPCRHEEEAKRLEEALLGLMKSADAAWYSGEHGGHDWREAIDTAHTVLVKIARRRAKEG